MYQGRFPVEFLLRDGQQFPGLTEGQARRTAAMNFHFKAALAQEQANEEPFVFSLAPQKQRACKEHLMAEIAAQYGYDLKAWKNHPA